MQQKIKNMLGGKGHNSVAYATAWQVEGPEFNSCYQRKKNFSFVKDEKDY